MTRGGARKGAGRPKGFGKYDEPTKAVRLPISMINAIHAWKNNPCQLPFYDAKVAAGFPSPAEDYTTENLDLNDHLIKHPAATFLVRATGTSMRNAGIQENDILVVDRSITPSPGKIVIAAIDGQFTVKRLQKQQNGQYILVAENPAFPPLEIKEGSEVSIWGVVTYIIHSAN